jgi:hypothetical protein
VYRSTDGGTNWTAESQAVPVVRIAIDPSAHSRVYAGTGRSGICCWDY